MSDKQKELELIAKEIEQCSVCKVNKIGKAVPGEGDSNAHVVFIGEAPGKKEAETGRPFVGRSGKFLRELIVKAGLTEEGVFITSPVKYLPEHVTPTPEEIEHGATHLDKQLAVIKPKVIVLLGRVACAALLKRDCSPAKEHGTIEKKDGRIYFTTYHPAAPLYSPILRASITKDFAKLKRLLELK
jgi:uracil-DNA glycosylase